MVVPENRGISQLRNLGVKMEKYLGECGITDERTLREVGAVEAYYRVKALQPRIINRMALYAIYGALTDQDCTRLPQETKDWLEEQLVA